MSARASLQVVVLGFLLACRQHVIEWVVANALPEAVDPVVLLLWAGSRHAVYSVLSLHHFSLGVCLAGLDEIIAYGVQLETVVLVAILHFLHLHIL